MYGKHAVLEVLKKRPDIIETLYIQEENVLDAPTEKLVKKAPKVEFLAGRKLPVGVDKRAVHQGWIAAVNTEAILVPFKTVKKELEVTPETCIVVLGEVQDPHNVGAIIRSAAAFGATAVLIPKHRQAPLTGTVMKVSTGSVFALPMVAVGNVNSALRDLKELGCWVYGLDMEGDANLHQEDFSRPSVFVVGNEGTGVRLKTHELCDSIISIPMHPRVESLNASVGAAIVLYAFSARHSKMLDASLTS